MVTSMSKLKVGIVGYGNIANRRHIPSYKKDSRSEITAITGPNLNMAQQVAKRHSIPNYYNNLEKMLKLDLDIISICTPPGTHSKISKIALENGCNVLVEKPMAMNIKEADEMDVTSKKYGIKLCIAHNFLFSQSMQKVLCMLKNDELGEIQDISAIQMSSTKRDLPVWYPFLPGKLFFDEIPHMIYTINQFIPSLNIKDIRKVSLSKNYPADNIYIDFSPSNTMCSLKMIFNAPYSEWKILVIGTKKCIIIDLFRDSLIVLGGEPSHSPISVLSYSLNFLAQNAYNDFNSGKRLLTKNLLFGHDLLIRKFIDSILEEEMVPVSAQQGRHVVEISDYIVNCLYKPIILSDNEFYRLRI